MKTKLVLSVIASIVAAAIAIAGAGQKKADIVDTAVAAEGFTTLVTAVKAAGLVDALKGEGPFTVFAPTDKAFEKLEKENPGILAKLLKPENKAELAKILKYHVVSGRVMAGDVVKLKDGTMVKTLNGASIKVTTSKGVMVDKAKVIKTDIVCTNGVIHVIDTVILPKS